MKQITPREVGMKKKKLPFPLFVNRILPVVVVVCFVVLTCQDQAFAATETSARSTLSTVSTTLSTTLPSSPLFHQQTTDETQTIQTRILQPTHVHVGIIYASRPATTPKENQRPSRFVEAVASMSSLAYYRTCPVTFHVVTTRDDQAMFLDYQQRYFAFSETETRYNTTTWFATDGVRSDTPLLPPRVDFSFLLLEQFPLDRLLHGIGNERYWKQDRRRDALLKLVVEHIWTDQTHMLVLDFDTLVLQDVCEMWRDVFDKSLQPPDTLFALAPELSEPRANFIQQFPKEAPHMFLPTHSWLDGPNGRKTLGFNTGVLFARLDRMKTMKWNAMWHAALVKWMDTHMDKGLLPEEAWARVLFTADQGIFNIALTAHPNLVSELHGGYNFELYGLMASPFETCDLTHRLICQHADDIRILHAPDSGIFRMRSETWLPLKRMLWMPFVDASVYGTYGHYTNSARLNHRYALPTSAKERAQMRKRENIVSWMRNEWQHCNTHVHVAYFIDEDFNQEENNPSQNTIPSFPLALAKVSIQSLLYYRTCPITIHLVGSLHIQKTLDELVQAHATTTPDPRLWYLTDFHNTTTSNHHQQESLLLCDLEPNILALPPVTFRHIKTDDFDWNVFFSGYHSHIPKETRTAALRLAAQELFPDDDKVLILDPDTLVVRDVCKVWREVFDNAFDLQARLLTHHPPLFAMAQSTSKLYKTHAISARITHLSNAERNYQTNQRQAVDAHVIFVSLANMRRMEFDKSWRDSVVNFLDTFRDSIPSPDYHLFTSQPHQTTENILNLFTHDNFLRTEVISNAYSFPLEEEDGMDATEFCRHVLQNTLAVVHGISKLATSPNPPREILELWTSFFQGSTSNVYHPLIRQHAHAMGLLAKWKNCRV